MAPFESDSEYMLGAKPVADSPCYWPLGEPCEPVQYLQMLTDPWQNPLRVF